MVEKFIEFLKGVAQPYITFLVVTAFVFMVVKGQIAAENLWWVMVALITFWFGDKAVKSLVGYVKNGSVTKEELQSVVKDEVINVFGSPQDEPVEEPVDTADMAPVPIPIPFDSKAFMDEVDRTTLARYTVVNPSTTFYNAEGVARLWDVNNAQAWKECRAKVFELAGEAFKSIWGVDYNIALTHLNDPQGCTTCSPSTCTYPDLKFKARQLGMGYYTALLDYERVRDLQ